MHRGWAAAAVLAGLVVAVAGHFHQFTWWGFTSFTLYLVLKATGRARDRELFFCTVAILIAVGVLAMATLAEEGSMLQESYREYGPLGYFAGTFVVHYLPPAVIVASMEPPIWSAREVTLLMGGLALFAVYLSVENPDEIYGVSIDSALASGMGVAFVIVAVYGLWVFAGR